MRWGWIAAGVALILAVIWALPHQKPETTGIPALLSKRGMTVKTIGPKPTRITIQEALVDSQTAHGNILLTPATTPTATLVSVNPGHYLAWLVTMSHVTVSHLSSQQHQQVSTLVVLINAKNGTWILSVPVHG